MGTILLNALLVLAAAVPPQAHRWTHYFNARFGTGLVYPADMFGRPFESDNGDGITLRARDSTSLAVWGKWNADVISGNPESPEHFVRWLASLPDYRQIRYRLVGPNFAVLSGLRGGRIFYERYVFAGREMVGRETVRETVHAFLLEYPVARRARWDPIAAWLSASLS